MCILNHKIQEPFSKIFFYRSLQIEILFKLIAIAQIVH
uniref:Bm14228 n=1 Tax=Brugia malayi TaxID=6279 RepID=A0A1I9G393_BRUMA|nr:Bm14228 [Brugia malayi]